MTRAPPSHAAGPAGLQLPRVLGSGGFADVFLYEQELPRRRVAVKVLLTDGSRRDRAPQFAAEANLMAQLSTHPSIVTIYQADVAADGRPYFVMEYCPGPTSPSATGASRSGRRGAAHRRAARRRRRDRAPGRHPASRHQAREHPDATTTAGRR